MCKIVIRAIGEITEDKLSEDTIEDIKTEIRKFSPNAHVTVEFRAVREPEGE